MTQSSPRWIRLAIWSIVVHALFSTLHGAAHQHLLVKLSLLQTLFVAIVISISPIVAGILLWKRVERVGAILLVLSMLASLIFGAYNHFVAISPDHVSHLVNVTNTYWVRIFQSTAVIIAVIETFGIWLGIRILKSGQDMRSV